MPKPFRSARDVRRTDVRLFRGVGILAAVTGVGFTVYVLAHLPGGDAVSLDGIEAGWKVLAGGGVVVLLGLILAALGTLIAAIDDDE